MATEVITKFTFRTYSEEEEAVLKKAQEHFMETSTTKAIKRALTYLFNELPDKFDYYRDIEKKYNKLKNSHDELLSLLRQRSRTEKDILEILNENK